MRKISCLSLVLAAASISLNVFSSDGVDRNRKFGPNTLYLFTEPQPGCGYSVLPKDSEGGADGTIEFRWVQEHLQALVRVCAYETEKEMGPAKYPLTIFDGSAENGDTPVDWEPTPRGRHPGGSHDGGINLDLGYYLTSIEGRQFNPDYAACTDHFEKGWDAFICKGPADKLDVPRMSYFYLRLFSINRELFGEELLSQIGADYFVKEAVVKQLETWLKEKKYGATQELLDDFKRVVTCDEYDGWAGSHHHHTHIRLNDIDLYGKLRPAVEKLLKMERDIDYKLLGGKDGKPFLRGRLLSSGLERAVEAEMLNLNRQPRDLLFRVGSAELRAPQKGDPRNRAVIPLPNGPFSERSYVNVKAEYSGTDERKVTLNKVVALPAQDPRLNISIDPARINAEAVQKGGSIVCRVTFPEIYKQLITDVFFEVQTEGKVQKYEADKASGTATIQGNIQPPYLINACVTLCGRKTIRIPVLVDSGKPQ